MAVIILHQNYEDVGIGQIRECMAVDIQDIESRDKDSGNYPEMIEGKDQERVESVENYYGPKEPLSQTVVIQPMVHEITVHSEKGIEKLAFWTSPEPVPELP